MNHETPELSQDPKSPGPGDAVSEIDPATWMAQRKQQQVTAMAVEELKIFCDLTLELTRIRQSHTKDLRIEIFAPELLAKLLSAWKEGQEGKPLDNHNWYLYETKN